MPARIGWLLVALALIGCGGDGVSAPADAGPTDAGVAYDGGPVATGPRLWLTVSGGGGNARSGSFDATLSIGQPVVGRSSVPAGRQACFGGLGALVQ